ncbi:MAG: DUF4292 domain-containing protein [Deltaproteobacteria bacterium]|nr:DUF4292 domain-containing protein [Deltaproteobacteria bacterium]
MNRLAIVSLLLLAGCPHRGPEFGPSGEITDAKAMIQLLAKQDTRFVTLQGNANFKVEAPENSGSLSQFVAATLPAELHIESMAIFGKLVSVVVCAANVFSVYDPDKNVFYTGPDSVQVFSRFVGGLPFTCSNAVTLLLGHVPRIGVDDGTLVLDAERHRYLLTLELQGVKQVLEIDTKTLDVVHTVFTGPQSFELTYDDFKDEPGGRFPHTLVLATGGRTFTYKYKDITLNGAPDLSLFHMDPPKGAKVVQLDEEGNALPPAGPALDGGH